MRNELSTSFHSRAFRPSGRLGHTATMRAKSGPVKMGESGETASDFASPFCKALLFAGEFDWGSNPATSTESKYG